MRTPTWMIVTAAALVALALGAGFAIWDGGWTREGVLSGTRITARWAFPLFLLAWTASSMAKLWPGGWRTQVLRRRRAVGLAFAASHFIHLGFVLAVVTQFGEARPLYVYVLGGGAYVMLAAMTLTSNDAAQRWMGRKGWTLLHTVGGWWLFLVFTSSYTGRLMEKPALAVPAVGLILAALMMRVAAAVKGRPAAQAA